MSKKILYPLSSFIFIFLLHAIYFLWQSYQISGQWVQIENASPLLIYLKRQDFLLGYSYALAGSFTIYAILKFIEGPKCSIVGVAGGMTLMGILSLGGCFLLGCCGSPMLGVYLALFGSSFLGFAKPLIAIITTISVVLGYFWIKNMSKRKVL